MHPPGKKRDSRLRESKTAGAERIVPAAVRAVQTAAEAVDSHFPAADNTHPEAAGTGDIPVAGDIAPAVAEDRD